jgi:hypothetical protein
MVRELREIVESIASIDTSVDIEDVKAIAQFDPETDRKIRELREFLLTLNIKPTKVMESEPMVPSSTVTYSKADADIVVKSDQYKELIDIGFTTEQVEKWLKLYNARKTAKKMSFVTCIKLCKFITDELAGNKNKALKVKLVQPVKNYLRIIDPNTEYNLCNVHDFLKGAALSCVSSQFFKFENGYIVGVKAT